MSDFVLVHGAWHGAWCWQRIVAPLWAAGHRAYAVTLTGSGERAHLLAPTITLQTHIADVVGVIEAEELRDAVVVGHSYAGIVITGVADRLVTTSSSTIGRLVYLDAVVPRPGEAWSSTHSDETRAQRRRAIAETGTIPAPDPAAFGLAGGDRAWVARRQTPHPGAVYDETLNFDADRLAALPKTFVDCTDPALPTIAESRRRARTEPGWSVVEIATGHDAMVSAPRALLEILLSLAR
ncbi:MAG TPA: alpha/beta hydrolase family protein [Burkholderiaceae bacterium]|nr:alpha/beta hydrolase family protein [Burkholderiaceae bacterium]